MKVFDFLKVSFYLELSELSQLHCPKPKELRYSLTKYFGSTNENHGMLKEGLGVLIIEPNESVDVSTEKGIVRTLRKERKAPSTMNTVPAPKAVKSTPKSPSVGPGLNGATHGFIGSIIFGRDLNGNFLCPFPNCGKSFANSQNARRHFDSVHGGLEFKCQLCHNNFKRKDILKKHAIQQHGLNEAMAKAMFTM